MRTTLSETDSGPDDLEVETAAARESRLVRLGFAEDVRPFRESALVVAVIAPLVTFVYRLYDAHWHIPFNYSGDALGTSTYTKSMIENGWYLSNPRLAAPFTANWSDFPLGGENLHWLGLKILGLVTGDYALAVNAYFVLGFFAIALVAYFVVRYLGFGIASALVVGALYAFLPFHAYRNVAHLTRGAYYSVPLCVLLIVWIIRYRGEFLRLDCTRWHVRRGRLAFALGVAVIVGSTDDQNVVFMASLLGVLALVGAARDRDWRPLALAGIVSAAAFGTLFVNNAPFVVARLERGANPEVANRPLSDQDYYGLRPVDLVLPAPGHRVKALRTIATKSARAQFTNSESAGTSLGIVGSIGLVWSLGAALVLALGARPRRASVEFVAQLGVVNIVAVAIGAIGGSAFLLALAGFRTYRTWNRISVFIAFCSLLVVVVALDELWALVRSRVRRPKLGLAIVAGIVAVLIVGGALDQTTPRYVPGYKAIATRFDIDATFYHDVEKIVPARSMVFQLPIAQFPEAGTINQMGDYQEFAAYLHTKTLRWSYGGIRGRREGDWQKELNITDPVGTLAEVAAIGFVGVVVDRTGFADRAASIVAAAAPVTGPPLLRTADDRLLYLDLTGLRARMQRELGADALARSAHIVLGATVGWTGFSYPEPICGDTRRWSTGRTATIELNNESSAPLTTDASTSFETNPEATRITVRAPGDTQSVVLTNGSGTWSHQLVLPPGKSQIQFTFGAPKVNAPNDPRTLFFALVRTHLGGPFDSPVATWAAGLRASCKPGS